MADDVHVATKLGVVTSFSQQTLRSAQGAERGRSLPVTFEAESWQIKVGSQFAVSIRLASNNQTIPLHKVGEVTVEVVMLLT